MTPNSDVMRSEDIHHPQQAIDRGKTAVIGTPATGRSASAAGEGQDPGRRETRPGSPCRAAALLVAAVAYALLAVLVYLPITPLDSSRLPGPRLGDPIQMVWFIAWTPFAILHGHNPLFTIYIDAPLGANLASNTLAPLLGILAAPITYTAGPVAALNLLFHLSLAASAFTMFWVLGRWSVWWPARFLGGCVYGFGAYMQFSARSNVNLVFLVIPPVVLACLDELLVRRRGSPLLIGGALGCLLALQLLVNPELLADLAVLTLVGVGYLALTNRHAVRRVLRYAARGIATAAVCFAALATWPVWMLVAGPRHVSGPLQPPSLNAGFHEDLIGPFVHSLHESTVLQGGVIHWGNSSGYFGIPLVVLLVVLAWVSWRQAIVRFSSLMAAVAFLLALGPQLTVDSHHTPLPLPEALFEHMPLLWNVLPIRLGAFQYLFAAIVLAVGLDHLYQMSAAAWRRHCLRMGALGRRRSEAAGLRPLASSPTRAQWIPVALIGLVVLALLPVASTYLGQSSGQELPQGYRSAASLVSTVTPQGGTVLTLPLPTGEHDMPMLWQAQSRMAFRLVGGYAFVPGPHGVVNKEIPSPWLASISRPRFHIATRRQAAVATRACTALLSVIRRDRIASVVVWHPAHDFSAATDSVVAAALGPATASEHGVSVWSSVQNRSIRPRCRQVR